MFFAGANPFISWLACLLFGMIDSIGARLQVYGLPSEFVMMMPYIATVAVLSVSMYIKKRRRQKQSSSIENGRSAKGHRATAIEQSRKAKR
jgi:simple sugar transport system permease protein